MDQVCQNVCHHLCLHRKEISTSRVCLGPFHGLKNVRLGYPTQQQTCQLHAGAAERLTRRPNRLEAVVSVNAPSFTGCERTRGWLGWRRSCRLNQSRQVLHEGSTGRRPQRLRVAGNFGPRQQSLGGAIDVPPPRWTDSGHTLEDEKGSLVARQSPSRVSRMPGSP